MTRLFDTGQPADGLEDELRRMLAVRENDITEAGRPPLEGDRLTLPPHRTSWVTELPGGRAGTLLAAAVVALLVLGSAFAVRGLRSEQGPSGLPTNPALNSPTARPTPTPTPTQTQTTGASGCPLPASWVSALAGGKIAVDQPQNYPLSAGPDGTFLMQQTATGQVGGQSDLTHDELAIFDRNGHGTTIWTATDPAHDYVDVSRDSATSAHWVVFGLTRSQNLAAHGVVAWNRATGQSTTIRQLSSTEEAANTVIDFDPVVAGDIAFWIEQKFNDNAHQTLVAQQLPAGTRSTVPVSQVQRLVVVAGAVLLLRGSEPGPAGISPNETMTLRASPYLDVPAAVASVGSGRDFTSDGSTLRWLADTPGASSLLSWRPGQSTVGQDTAINPPPGADWVGPFLLGQLDPVGASTLFDLRDGSRHILPAGLILSLLTGTDLIVTSGGTKSGGASVHRVPLSALPATPC